jgi:OmpA-OmpF porin, OOP family
MAASQSSFQHGSSSTTRVVTRRWVRLQPARWPFFVWGLLPLLGLIGTFLYALTSFARGDIEANVSAKTADVLKDAPWAAFDVSGQHVTISGVEPEAGAGQRLVDAVRAAQCDTAFGLRTCAVDVTGDFASSPTPPAAAPIAAAPEAPATPQADAVAPDYLFERTGKLLRLTGEMPSDAFKLQVADSARKLYSGTEVTVEDAMTVKAANAIAGYDAILQRGVDAIARCEEGRSALTNGEFSLRCSVKNAVEAGLRADASASLNAPLRVGAIELISAEAANQCEQSFTDLLSASKIEFSTGSARISANSNPLLDKLAEAARNCPGTLRVEGHTDSVGSLASNMTLSQARADSVKAALQQRGLDVARMQAEGFGPNQPLGDNATADGRSRNRRIEFKIVSF